MALRGTRPSMGDGRSPRDHRSADSLGLRASLPVPQGRCRLARTGREAWRSELRLIMVRTSLAACFVVATFSFGAVVPCASATSASLRIVGTPKLVYWDQGSGKRS